MHINFKKGIFLFSIMMVSFFLLEDVSAIGIVDGEVATIVTQSNGKFLIGGQFDTYGGVNRYNIARVNADGSLDTTFDPGNGTGSGESLEDIVVQPDGKILIGGWFRYYDSVWRGRVARINADGSLDTTFAHASGEWGADSDVYALALQSDGKILIGGYFTEYDSVSRSGIARLNADGTLDTTFSPITGVDAYSGVLDIIIQSDGKILIGGKFSTYDGVSRNGIARLNADGTLDTTFDPGSGASDVYSMQLQSDGKILIGGDFGTVNGVSRDKIARLNSDGSLDTTFDPGTGADDWNPVRAVSLQTDGKILIGGNFDEYNGTSRHKIARLNADGSLDTTFVPQTGFDGGQIYMQEVMSLAVESDGDILVGGDNFMNATGGDFSTGLVRLTSSGNDDGTIFPFMNVSISYTNLTMSGVTIVGDVLANAGEDVTRSIEVYDSVWYEYTELCSVGTGGLGQYTCDLTGVTPGETYQVRAVISNSIDEVTSEPISIEIPTTSLSSPTVTTLATLPIEATFATGNGEITDTGGDDPERFIEWGTTAGVYIDSCSAGIGGIGTYSCEMTSLTPDTMYYFRAYATNSEGTGYGSESSFTTLSSITSSTSEINLSITIEENLGLNCGGDIDIDNGTALVASIPQSNETICTVVTNDDHGYILSVANDNPGNTLTNGTYSITDKTVWDNTVPNAQAWSGTGLGFSVYDSDGTKEESWWGNGSSCHDVDNLYAGFPTTDTPIMEHEDFEKTSTDTHICYRVDVPVSQASGEYTGSVTYTATGRP